jgi:hypothetical protein
MINHARTLLLNMPSAYSAIRAETAAEYVPPSFSPVALTSPLRALRRVLLGSDPDARFLNLRVRELIGYIHQTELAEFVYALDPRVTYWPVQETEFFDSTRKTLTVTQIKGAPRRLSVTGTFQANNSVGRTLQQYLLTAGNETLPTTQVRTVSVLQRIGKLSTDIVTEVGDASNPAIISLPDTKLKARLDFGVNPSQLYGRLVTEINDIILLEEYASSGFLLENNIPNIMPMTAGVNFDTITAQWLLTAKASPAPVITTLLPALELMGESVFLNLFGVNPDEPYKTFKNLWFDHYAPAYRLAGLVLAAIYRTEELRRHIKNG